MCVQLMSCKEFVSLFASESSLAITDIIGIYEIYLEWVETDCFLSDSDTFEKILIKDPENLQTKY